MMRECPELRILEDELAAAVKAKLNLGSMRFGKNAADLRRDGRDPGRRVDVYPTVLVRPVCSGCGKPMALSRSTGKYKSFVCLNAIHGGHGCRNKGNKSARIIDEAVLKAVSAQILDEGFITDLTAEVNIRLAEAARRPRDTERKLEQEITSRQRQVSRLTERLEKVEDAGGLDTIFNKVAELNRQLEAKRAELREEQRRNRRPPVTSVKEKDVVLALTQLREVLLADVGRAAPVLQALVGDVVVESKKIEGRKRPEMVAKFTIDGIPALAALDRGKGAGADDPTVGMWESLFPCLFLQPGAAGDRHLFPCSCGTRNTSQSPPDRQRRGAAGDRHLFPCSCGTRNTSQSPPDGGCSRGQAPVPCAISRAEPSALRKLQPLAWGEKKPFTS
jgi:hypothetical protein